MSLRLRILLVLVVVIGIFSAVTDQLQSSVFGPRFAALEEQRAVEGLDRVRAALNSELEELETLGRGIACRPDVRRMAAGREEAGAPETLVPASFDAWRLDLVYLVADGADAARLSNEPRALEVRFARIVHPETGAELTLDAFPTGTARIAAGHPALERAKLPDPSGILLTERWPLLVSAHQLEGDGSSAPGTSAGTLIVGRFLDAGLGQILGDRSDVGVEIWQADGRDMSAEIAEVLPLVTGSATPLVRPAGDEAMEAFCTLNDLRARPEILVRATTPRDVSVIGATALRSGLLTNLIVSGLMLLALLSLLKWIVLDPITRLTQSAVAVGERGAARPSFANAREDEIGTLAREFEAMLERLDEAQRLIVETARTAGMSEIATGILHNVGNVLNSVNVSANLASQHLDDLGLDDLEKLSAVLAEHAGDLSRFIDEDPRGKHLQPFLAALTTQLGEQRGRALQEMESLTRGIDHICDLVRSQQAYAGRGTLASATRVDEVIDEAVRIADTARSHHKPLEFRTEVQDFGLVEVDRRRLLEILVNLVQNAVQALAGQDVDPRKVSVTAVTEGDEIRIDVSDNGRGIAAENLTRIFALGFTTRTDGLGYGLHTAANAATELHGTLEAASPGVGRGATFTLRFPKKPAPSAGQQTIRAPATPATSRTS